MNEVCSGNTTNHEVTETRSSVRIRVQRVLGGALTLLAAVLLFLTAAGAQVSTGTIQGTILDASGAVVVGAHVTITNEGTGIARSVATDDHGRYTAPDLLIGKYDVKAENSGFQTTVTTGVTVTVGEVTVADFRLVVGQVSQTVTVEGQSVQVDTSSADFASLVNQNQLDSLPLNGRDYEQLILLAPGVDKNVTQGTNSTMGRDQSFSVAGARPQGQYVILDGTNVQNFWNRGGGNTLVGTSLGIESIAEFTVLTNSYGAEYGGTGSVVNQVTRSGTNSFHGTAYDYLRNSVFDSRNYFDPASGPPSFHRNQFGGSIGGPIKRDKAFFFVNYEGLRQSLGEDPIVTVPTNLVRGIDPADPAGEGCVPPPAGSPSGTPNSCYPLTAVQKTALNDYAPDPGPEPAGSVLKDFGNGARQTRLKGAETVRENYVNTRVDYNLSPSDSIFARVVNDPASQDDPFGPTGSFTQPEYGTGLSRYATVEYKKILSPSLINLVRFGFVRTVLSTVYIFNPNAPFTYSAGADHANGTLAITPLSTLGIDSNDPITFRQNKFQEADDVIWTHGGHTSRFGFSVMRVQTNDNTQLGLGGSYTFPSITAFFLNQQCPIVNGTVANCTTGPTGFSGSEPGFYNSTRSYREIDLSPYFQDDWKISRNLTVNLGVRYDYTTNPVETHNVLHEITDPSTSTGYSPIPHVFASNPNWRNVQPRIGFAYSPFSDHKTAIRGGFDMYDDLVQPRLYAEGDNSNPPYYYGTATDPNPFPIGFTTATIPAVSQPQSARYRNPYASYIYEYNLNIQRQLSLNSSLTVGYLGSNGRRWWTMNDLNPPVPTADPSAFEGVYIANGLNLENPAIGVVNQFIPEANSNYNSLQATYNDFFRNFLQSQISYTYSKCLDFGSAEDGTENNGTSTIAFVDPYPGGQKSEYGRCNFDVRHNLTANATLALPFHGNRLVSGWQFNSILTARTGQAFSVGEFHQSRITSNSTERPDWAPGWTNFNPITDNPADWINKAAFVLQPPGEFGDETRNMLSTAGLFDVDFAIVKNTAITERVKTQFRAEFFNIINHSNFGAPASSLFTNASGATNATFGEITTTTTTARQIQFALKFLF